MSIARPPQIFTPEERDQNEARKNELFELVASGESLLVVGAGSSAFVGYDTWPELIKKLEELAHKCGGGFVKNDTKRENMPLEYAQEIKEHINDKTGSPAQYHDLLCSLYKPRNVPLNDFHRLLVRLPFKGFLTTNYDIVLEEALCDKNPESGFYNSLVIGKDAPQLVSDFLLSLDLEQDPWRVAHLHGRFDCPDSIVLSLDDYLRVYGMRLSRNRGKSEDATLSQTLHCKLLWAIFATRQTVFVGFSMKDPYLNVMLEIVSKDLWRWEKSIHFAVMDISPETADRSKIRAEYLRREYGVGVVFYEDFDKSHQGLKRIVSELARKCGVEPISDWMEMISQQMEERIKIHGS